MKFIKIAFWLMAFGILNAQTKTTSVPKSNKLNEEVSKIEKQVIEWRRHIHQHPELSNREFETNKFIVETLSKYKGLEIKSPVAKTGVVAILKGALPGPVIALRADIDALPVEEKNDLPFKSQNKQEYNKEMVPVMHACGHDAHTAILLGTAKLLSEQQSQLKGTVVFIFQPAEEGPPNDEEGGAPLMIKEGALDNPKVEAIFGLHVSSITKDGDIAYKKGSAMASSDWFVIKVKGKGTHGARPWGGRDPIQASAGIIQAIQSIVSRRLDIVEAPAVITVGKIHSGLRPNIIPDEAIMEGTIRTLDPKMQKEVHAIMKETVENSARSFGVEAEISISTKTLVTYNNPELTEKILPSLSKSLSESGKLYEGTWVTGAEDFSFFSDKVPGVFFWLGARPEDCTEENAPPHHTTIFRLSEKNFSTGVRAFLNIVKDYTKSEIF